MELRARVEGPSRRLELIVTAADRQDLSDAPDAYVAAVTVQSRRARMHLAAVAQ